MKTTLADLTDTVSGAVGDALAAGSHFAHDVAATTAEKASGLASSAAERVPDLQAHAAELVDTARRKVGRPPRRSRRRSWLVVAAALATFVAIAVVVRRRHSEPAVDRGSDGGANPVRSHTARAAAAAGS